LDMAKPIFMGINNEEKHMPRFNYNCTIWLSKEQRWCGPKKAEEFDSEEAQIEYMNFRALNGYVTDESDDEFEIVRRKARVSAEKWSYHVSICKHPDP
jgi:hypothetical protein